MKMKRILAASTAALLAFGTTAVVASAATAALDTFTSVAAASLADDQYAISFDAGTTYTIVGVKDLSKYSATANGTAYTAAGLETAIKAALDADATALKKTEGDVTVSIAQKDALKLKGQYQVKIAEKSVGSDEDDKVYFDEDGDEDITKLGLSKKNIDILKKTDASKVKLIEVNVGKGGDVVSSIGKSLKVEVDKTWGGAKVYHVNGDGSLNEITANTNNPIAGGDKKTTFTTSNFSSFIITTATLDAKAAASTDDSSAASTATSNGTASTNPDTGIALAIAPVVLAAGAVAVVALKKKH